ncbi:sensor histidine kinase [Candidatus Omnitrophota bacterium]
MLFNLLPMFNLIAAATAAAVEDKVNIGIIISVAIGSIILGVVVANFAKMRGYVEGKSVEPAKAKLSSQAINSAIWKQINRLNAPATSRRQAAEAISNILAEELDKESSLLNLQLSQKFESTITATKQAADIIYRKYEKLNLEKKQTEAVIRSIAEGLVVVNDTGEVLLMNPAAEHLLGVKKEEKIGQSIKNDLKEDQLISIVTETADKHGKEVEVASGEDETKKILRASSAVIENEYGKTVGMVSVLTDVTKQKEIDQLKSDFVSKVSHELRTPIVTVQNSISLLLSKAPGAVSADQEKFLNIAQRNLKRLGSLIDDLLDLSKLEATKMELKFESYAIKKLIDEIYDSLYPWASSKSITIERIIASGLPKTNMDFNRMIQVLNNLIGNAIKFTPQGGTITVEAKIGQDKKEILISVTDTGVGIAKEDLEKVFDKFQQSGERAATDISGTGLGLSIAKELVQLHGGRIWAESETGAGAKFIFTLPIT